MKTTALAAALAAVLLVTTAAADDTASPHARLIEQKAGTVVAVKFVLHVNLNFGGRAMDREMTGEAIGVVVDPVGLVMVSNSNFDVSSMLPGRMQGVEAQSSATNLRVVFPGDTKEYDAILGAKDSKLGLAFVRIKDLAGKAITAIDLGEAAEPEVGGRVYGVSRLDQGFDYAPFCTTANVVGYVTKPRKMWLLENADDFVAQPLFTEAGRALGVVVTQRGVGEDASTLSFLLPLKVAEATIKQATGDSAEALEEALAREAEAAAAGEKPPETPAAPDAPSPPEAPDSPKPPEEPSPPAPPQPPR
jgi:hypothetical protein